MPSILEFLGYKIYFWSNESYEPIHVHISKGSPSENSTKIWITKVGGCVVANNNSNIPINELNKLLKVISGYYLLICAKWKEYFDTDIIKFYC